MEITGRIEETEDEFYDRLQNIFDNYLEKVMTLLMGDMNVKIGEDNIGYEEVMGRHGLGEINNSGEKPLYIYVHQTNSSLEAVYFPTKAYIKQHGYYRIMLQ